MVVTTNLEFGGVLKMKGEGDSQDFALKRWRFFAIFWPLLCLAFAGIIVYQPERGMEERIADVAFTVIPLIFLP